MVAEVCRYFIYNFDEGPAGMGFRIPVKQG